MRHQEVRRFYAPFVVRFTVLAGLLYSIAGCSSRTPLDLPPHELSMRFTHPELFAGRDDSARSNALQAMLEGGILTRGMRADEITPILGPPDKEYNAGNPEVLDRIVDQPFVWEYGNLEGTDFHIDFDAQGLATAFVWRFPEPYGRKNVW